ncbi:striatin-3 isoform X3 [Syngnathoides biaculeatus]|uniref:striatin-3 isoform X3 n=1 Tax=Syngnathoides biaculeatus TaxID=300417 RepID=UPI002ADE49DE|nr:striatin-3 isoform X3 [Syngnathoides biaculeatus]
MEEHPGGGAAGPPPLPQQQQQQQLPLGGAGGAHPAVGGGPGTLLGPQQSDDLPRPQQQYTIPGVLHYIQHEWARFEMERAHWEVERAELQARIAFLQGERKGQENLKNDLVRRIKMLEFALKQERAKYHKLKYGTELNQGDLKLPSFEPDAKDSDVSALPPNSQLTWKQGRQLLRQYLQEVGYTDTILDVRTQRVRSLLGLNASEQNGSLDKKKKNLQQLINGNDAKRTPGDVLETFNFLENAEDSDEDEDEDGELMDDIGDDVRHLRKHKNKVGNEGLASEDDDADTEEALKEFDFLVTAEDGEGAGEARSSGDGTEWAEPLPFAPGGGKNFLMGGADHVLESVLGLGDLADLTVTNDDVDFNYDLLSNQESSSSFRKTWNPKYTLRSHFDGVRALAFHPAEPCLLTVSEDHTLKLWNLTKTVAAKNRSASLDVEPVYTFRAHVGPVLSLAVTSSGEQCFSGGVDATIQWWNVPSSNVDPYDTYDASTLAGTWTGHTDAVWGLAYSGVKNRLLSCSADGTIKLWNPCEGNPCISTFNTAVEHGVPTSVDFNGCDPARVTASFDGGDVAVYDLETSQSVLVLKGQGEGSRPGCHHIYKVASHPTLPVTITAHEDRNIKFFDNKSGKMIHAMVAHLDAVTSLAVDPNGIYLMSGSHDCSLRLWNLDSKTCVQEITAHRKKSDEAIYDVTFHPSKAYIASAGADALARVYV